MASIRKLTPLVLGYSLASLMLTNHCAMALEFYASAGAGTQQLAIKRQTTGYYEPWAGPNMPFDITTQLSQHTTASALSSGLRYHINPYLAVDGGLDIAYNSGKIVEHYGFHDATNENFTLSTSQPWNLDLQVMPMLNWPRYHNSLFFISGFALDYSKTQSSNDGGGYYGPNGTQQHWSPGYILGAGLEQRFALKQQHFALRASWRYRHDSSYTINSADPSYVNDPISGQRVEQFSYYTHNRIELSAAVWLAKLSWLF